MTKKRQNPDELRVVDIANSIDGVVARLADGAEDCGHQKADVVAEYGRRTFYFQVSHTPKSGKEQEKLISRGTYPIHVYRYSGMPESYETLASRIKAVLEG
jgi:hypothetical protein